MASGDITAGIKAALRVGAVTADVVAVEARRAATERLTTDCLQPITTSGDAAVIARPAALERPVVSLTQRRLADPAAVIAGLPPDARPLPSVASYDELLTRRTSDLTRDPARHPSSDQRPTGTTT